MHSNSAPSEFHLQTRKTTLNNNFIAIYNCPGCRTPTDYRIRKELMMKKLFPWLRRYWCPRCFNRFYVFKRELRGIAFRKASQNLPLESVYLACWFHAIPLKAANGFKDNTFIYLVTGINKEGNKHILSLCISNSEKEFFWQEVFQNLKSRGLMNILITCSDLSDDLRNSLANFFPHAIHLDSFTRQIRRSAPYIPGEKSHEFFEDLHSIYETDDIQSAHPSFISFNEKWSNVQSYPLKWWENNWTELSRYLVFQNEIRNILLSDQILDHLESELEKFKQLKNYHPNQKSTLRFIEKTVGDTHKKTPLHPLNSVKILNQFKLFYLPDL